jgi:hypothetical protein
MDSLLTKFQKLNVKIEADKNGIPYIEDRIGIKLGNIDTDALMKIHSNEHQSYAIIGDKYLDLIFARLNHKSGGTPESYDRIRQKVLCNSGLERIFLRLFARPTQIISGLESTRVRATFLECLVGILSENDPESCAVLIEKIVEISSTIMN